MNSRNKIEDIIKRGDEAIRYYGSDEVSLGKDAKAFKDLFRFAWASKKIELIFLSVIITILRHFGKGMRKSVGDILKELMPKKFDEEISSSSDADQGN